MIFIIIKERDIMELKGTQSEKNIKAALMGESLARNKNTFFAAVEKK